MSWGESEQNSTICRSRRKLSHGFFFSFFCIYLPSVTLILKSSLDSLPLAIHSTGQHNNQNGCLEALLYCPDPASAWVRYLTWWNIDTTRQSWSFVWHRRSLCLLAQLLNKVEWRWNCSCLSLISGLHTGSGTREDFLAEKGWVHCCPEGLFPLGAIGNWSRSLILV